MFSRGFSGRRSGEVQSYAGSISYGFPVLSAGRPYVRSTLGFYDQRRKQLLRNGIGNPFVSCQRRHYGGTSTGDTLVETRPVLEGFSSTRYLQHSNRRFLRMAHSNMANTPNCLDDLKDKKAGCFRRFAEGLETEHGKAAPARSRPVLSLEECKWVARHHANASRQAWFLGRTRYTSTEIMGETAVIRATGNVAGSNGRSSRDESNGRTLTLDVRVAGQVGGSMSMVRVTAPDGTLPSDPTSIASASDSSADRMTLNTCRSGEVSPYSASGRTRRRLECEVPIGGWFVWGRTNRTRFS